MISNGEFLAFHCAVSQDSLLNECRITPFQWKFCPDYLHSLGIYV